MTSPRSLISRSEAAARALNCRLSASSPVRDAPASIQTPPNPSLPVSSQLLRAPSPPTPESGPRLHAYPWRFPPFLHQRLRVRSTLVSQMRDYPEVLRRRAEGETPQRSAATRSLRHSGGAARGSCRAAGHVAGRGAPARASERKRLCGRAPESCGGASRGSGVSVGGRGRWP